jgi:hypothetical protein
MEPPIVTVGLFAVTVATVRRHPWHGDEKIAAVLNFLKYRGL